MPTDTLLWDFDGLICDTERAAYRSWELLYARHGQVFPDEVWEAMAGRATGESHAAQDLAGRLGRDLSVEEMTERRAVKARLADAEPLRPGVARLLENAGRRGIRCAVVSSSDGDWVRGHLERLRVLDRFTLVVTGEQVEARKPAPDLYLRALDLLGTGPDTGLALEDSPIGVAAAKAAGLTCVAVPGARGVRTELIKADMVLDSLEQLERFDVPRKTTKVMDA
ncbi:HAD family hydrolase [Streptomyces sp. NBC_00328]|uniref:HAD family hydrolase n=1 Tax=Streptomyces sp. NBC_00328 TaxID=2903646 RepID=UPI002E2AB161|nr:HAD-IA family hydrolase [Streptomyces sp. NBC_00328]